MLFNLTNYNSYNYKDIIFLLFSNNNHYNYIALDIKYIIDNYTITNENLKIKLKNDLINLSQDRLLNLEPKKTLNNYKNNSDNLINDDTEKDKIFESEVKENKNISKDISDKINDDNIMLYDLKHNSENINIKELSNKILIDKPFEFEINIYKYIINNIHDYKNFIIEDDNNKINLPFFPYLLEIK